MSRINQFDIVIVGGGMVGLAMAASLAKSDLKVVLIERLALNSAEISNTLASAPNSSVDFDIRVSAISPRNQQFLSHLGAWSLLPAGRIAEYQKMFVWDGESSGEIEFDAAEMAQKSLGSIIENRMLQAALFQSIYQQGNIQILEQMEITEIENGKEQVVIKFESGREISSRLLIGADGGQSQVRKLMGTATLRSDYDQTAFVATVETAKPHQDTAWQRFTRYGPVAFLPLPIANLCSIVWSADQEQSEKIKQLDRQAFERELAKAFEYRLGAVTLASEFRGFPLIKQHAEHYIKNRCILIGDAAHTIHPLAGQGVNLGFQDAECLSQRILELVCKGRDFSNPLNLASFERERKAHNKITQEAMSGFKWLFGKRELPLIVARSIGMSQLNRTTSLKNLIASQAMGIST